MKLDLYTRAVLTVIALMLLMIVAKPLMIPETALAASQKHYLVKATSIVWLERDLNDFAAKGWELVTLFREESGGYRLLLKRREVPAASVTP
jgi:hypothetical protein